jgi:hypothetical protein
LVHGSIQIALLSIDPDKHFIDKPLIATGTRSFSQSVGVDWAEARTPSPDHFIRYIDSTLGQKLFDITIT